MLGRVTGVSEGVIEQKVIWQPKACLYIMFTDEDGRIMWMIESMGGIFGGDTNTGNGNALFWTDTMLA